MLRLERLQVVVTGTRYDFRERYGKVGRLVTSGRSFGIGGWKEIQALISRVLEVILHACIRAPDREASVSECTHSYSPALDIERQFNSFGFISWSRVISTWTPVGMCE